MLIRKIVISGKYSRRKSIIYTYQMIDNIYKIIKSLEKDVLFYIQYSLFWTPGTLQGRAGRCVEKSKVTG